MAESQPDSHRAQRAFRDGSLSVKTAIILATWFGSGLLPFAPGTFGTLAGLPVILGLGFLAPPFRLIALVFVVAAAVWSSGQTEKHLCEKDPKAVVIDEVAGFGVTMSLFPTTLTTLCAGFILFRLCDILKPYPVKKLEGLRGGAGIVADDIMAGLYACAGTWLIVHLLG